MLPLIAECTKRETECQMLRHEVKERTKNLKILFAMIRSPKMCDLVYKEERKQYTKEKVKLLSDNAILTLR